MLSMLPLRKKWFLEEEGRNMAIHFHAHAETIAADEKFVRKAKEFGYSSSVMLLADWTTPRIIN